MNTNGLVMAAIVSAAGLHLLVDIKTHGRRADQYRIGMAALLLLAFLLLLAEVWPAGARGIAIVVLLTAFAMNGQQFAALITSLVDGKGEVHV